MDEKWEVKGRKEEQGMSSSVVELSNTRIIRVLIPRVNEIRKTTAQTC